MRWMYSIMLATGLLSACDDAAPRFTDAAPPRDSAEPFDAGTELDAPVGHPGSGLVTGAVKASSANYTLYGTLRSGDGSSASPNYQRRGGITGATQP